MNGFKILKEETINLKGGRLCVLLTSEKGKCGVEVVNDRRGFGRKYTDNRDEAEFLFDALFERISTYKKVADAEKAVKKCLSFRSIDKIVFVLLAEEKIVTQNFIVVLRKKIRFRTTIKLNYKRRIKKNGALTIYISSEFDKKPFGVFTGTDEAKDLKFKLI